jgi:hypothetical protein
MEDISQYIHIPQPVQIPTVSPNPTPTPEPTPTPTPGPTPLIVPQNPVNISNPVDGILPVTIQQNAYYSFSYPSPIVYSVNPPETPTTYNTNSSNPYVLVSNTQTQI